MKLPFYTNHFQELENEVLQDPLVDYQVKEESIVEDSTFDEYHKALNIIDQVARFFESKIAYILKNNQEFTLDSEYLDILSFAFEAIYFYDYELNQIDKKRHFLFSMMNKYPFFYFKMLLKNEHNEKMYNYLTLLNKSQRFGIKEAISNPVYMSKGRKNKGQGDINFFQATMDLLIEDLSHPVPFALNHLDERFSIFSFIITLNNISTLSNEL